MPKTSNYNRPAGKLLDECRAEFDDHDLPLPGELKEVGVMGDLAWTPPSGRKFDFAYFSNEDPAILVDGYSRYVVFWRIEGEIRYYAAPIEPHTRDWYQSGEDPLRIAAADTETDYHEMAILASVKDAVRLTMEYLNGKPLADIQVSRIAP